MEVGAMVDFLSGVMYFFIGVGSVVGLALVFFGMALDAIDTFRR
jgi:hypothetical protein